MKIELILKNSKLKSYHVMSWIIVLFNSLAQLTFLFTPAYEHEKILVLSMLAVILFIYIAGKSDLLKFLKKREATGTIIAWICIIWFRWEFYWIAAANIILFILYIYATRKFEVIVSENNIRYPSFPKRQIEWNELQNVIMKGGILTIDFKNNKLLQAETADEESVDEKQFNEFCREQLKK